MRRLERGRLKETLHPDQRGNLPVFDVGITVLGVGGGDKNAETCLYFFCFSKGRFNDLANISVFADTMNVKMLSL